MFTWWVACNLCIFLGHTLLENTVYSIQKVISDQCLFVELGLCNGMQHDPWNLQLLAKDRQSRNIFYHSCEWLNTIGLVFVKPTVIKSWFSSKSFLDHDKIKNDLQEFSLISIRSCIAVANSILGSTYIRRYSSGWWQDCMMVLLFYCCTLFYAHVIGCSLNQPFICGTSFFCVYVTLTLPETVKCSNVVLIIIRLTLRIPFEFSKS